MIDFNSQQVWNGDSVVFCRTRGEWGGFSNMATGFPILVNGTVVKSSEGLYQLCRFPNNPDLQGQIGRLMAYPAKLKAYEFIKDTRSDWDTYKVDIMRWCLRAKAAANPVFRKLLKNSGGGRIVEFSVRDRFWGAGQAATPNTLVGTNVLGQLLSELRRDVQAATPIDVAPPKIVNFKVFGAAVEHVGPARK